MKYHDLYHGFIGEVVRFRDALDLDDPKFVPGEDPMPSFQIAIEPNRRAAARFVQQVRRALQKAFVEEQEARGLSQSEIARLLKVNRSVINRELKGFKDITLGRVAELAWAMGRQPKFSIAEPIHAAGANHLPVAHPGLANAQAVRPIQAATSNAGVYNVPSKFASAA